MKKRKPKPRPDFIDAVKDLTIEELQTASVQAGAAVNIARHEYQEAQIRFASIRHAINLKFLNGKMGISDHAVIRYLERSKGMDIEAVRDEIRRLAEPYKNGELVPLGDGCHGVLFRGEMMATVLSGKMRPKEPPTAEEEKIKTIQSV